MVHTATCANAARHGIKPTVKRSTHISYWVGILKASVPYLGHVIGQDRDLTCSGYGSMALRIPSVCGYILLIYKLMNDHYINSNSVLGCLYFFFIILLNFFF